MFCSCLNFRYTNYKYLGGVLVEICEIVWVLELRVYHVIGKKNIRIFLEK